MIKVQEKSMSMMLLFERLEDIHECTHENRNADAHKNKNFQFPFSNLAKLYYILFILLFFIFTSIDHYAIIQCKETSAN